VEVLLKKLLDAGARFVVIGGQAMLQEGMPRFTLDWDIFVPPRDLDNFQKINQALADDLDMELEPFDFLTGDGIIQTTNRRERPRMIQVGDAVAASVFSCFLLREKLAFHAEEN